jgi:drug/metabolite transporter (DMT)-like permease
MEKRSAFLLVLSTAIISGFSIYLNKFAVKGIDSDVFTFSKNLLVGVFMLSLVLFFTGISELKKLSRKNWAKLILIGVIGGSVPFVLFFRGLQITSAASASLVHKAMFVFVSLLAFMFLKEKLDKKIIFAMGLLLVGNYFMIKPTLSFNLGDLLIVSATLLWAVENTISKHTLKDLSGNAVAFGRMFFGSLFILVYLFFTGKSSILLNLTMPQLQWILITSGMLVLYVVTWYNGLKYMDVSLATAVLLLGSPITTLLSLTSGAIISIGQAFGILLLVLGIVLYMYSTGYINIESILKAWTKKTKA